MKKIVFAPLFALLAVACGGPVNGAVPSVSDATPVPTSSGTPNVRPPHLPDAPLPRCGRKGEALCVDNLGSDAGDVRAGTVGVELLRFTITAGRHDVTVQIPDFRIASSDGGVMLDAAGVTAFQHFRLVETKSGTLITDALADTLNLFGSPGYVVSFDNDMICLPARGSRTISLVADAADAEEPAGSFFGHTYAASMDAFASADVLIDGQPVDLGRIDPVQPQLGADLVLVR